MVSFTYNILVEILARANRLQKSLKQSPGSVQPPKMSSEDDFVAVSTQVVSSYQKYCDFYIAYTVDNCV